VPRAHAPYALRLYGAEYRLHPRLNPPWLTPELGARHLLIKHAQSRNPVSRRTGGSTANVDPAAAAAELQTYIEKIQAEGSSEVRACVDVDVVCTWGRKDQAA
jgi:hypothetical protein